MEKYLAKVEKVAQVLASRRCCVHNRNSDNARNTNVDPSKSKCQENLGHWFYWLHMLLHMQEVTYVLEINEQTALR